MQYIEGLKLLFYELMDAAKGLILPEVLRHYAETAGQVVQELVRKVQKVRAVRLDLNTVCVLRLLRTTVVSFQLIVLRRAGDVDHLFLVYIASCPHGCYAVWC